MPFYCIDKGVHHKALPAIKNLPSIPSFCETDIRLEVSSRLGTQMRKITGKKGRIAFELGGAQGIELALKIVKANTRKSQFVVFEGGYHGRSIFTSQLSASHRYRSLMGDWRIPVIRLPYPDFEQTYPKQSPSDAKTLALSYITRLIENEVGGMSIKSKDQDIAALIIEPVLNAGGIVKPEKDFLETVVKKFRHLGALIVVDEIFCGFYRTGKMFGFQHYDFVPDIVVMSKAITNGITPLSCVWAREPYMDSSHYPPGTHSATYINNPVALSVANVVLNRYEKWKSKTQDIKNLEKRLNNITHTIVKTSPLVKSGFAIGGVGRILLKNNNAAQILDIARVINRTKPIDGIHGLILASTGMAPNVVALNPPLNILDHDIDILEKLVINTFQEADKKIHS